MAIQLSQKDRDDTEVGLKKVGGFLGFGNMTKPGDDTKNAQGYTDQATNAYSGISAPDLAKVSSEPVQTKDATAYSAGPSAYNGISVDATGRQAQQAQLAALANLSKNGGRSASSDSNLAGITQEENANAAGQRGAIMQNARARGMGNNSNSLLAQLSSSQNATNNQSARDLAVRGQDQQTAINAGQAAAGIGANMEGQNFNEQAQKAAAADAIDRFNAGNNQQVSVFNAGQQTAGAEADAGRAQQAAEFNSGLGQQEFADTMGVAKGEQEGGKIGQDYWSDKYKEDEKANSEQQKGGLGMIASLFAAGGGRVPGHAKVPGDSILNDGVKINTSPGEVVVPRTLASSGSKAEIGSFVKKAPVIGKDREAMLGALANLRRRR